ncbi:carbon monoxide dehydrogenase subunit G [Jatrophihabitans sp. GAS493]|uniref:SRPBCC family protein n=1 Tax=Jatrophihabitans sp. GAS493 TaxID=1907575 RepID=UPI000BC048B5|nr:SRPBCC family protein [Jatrophihabitans sp. GAS493]SOD73838.1 carbon monoxide dehydrogenase subunit G [Jatrophihabitans sp. GAS493]
MAKLHRYAFTHEIDASPQKVWDLVADHEGMSAWSPVRSVTLEKEGAPDRNGVGAIRVLRLAGPPLREQITAFEPTHHLAYRMLSGAPVTDYTGEINVTPSGAGSRLVWSVQFRPKLPGAQFVVAVVIREGAKALAKRAARS